MRTRRTTKHSSLSATSHTITPFAMHIIDHSPSIKEIKQSLDEFIEDGNAVCIDGLWRTQLCQYRDRRTYGELLIHFIKEYYYEFI